MIIKCVSTCCYCSHMAMLCHKETYWILRILSSKQFLLKFEYKVGLSDMILFCRSQDFAREELLYLVLKTRSTVMSFSGTSLFTACASPWPASSFCSLPSWLASVAAKTRVLQFKMGKYSLEIYLDWNTRSVGDFASVTSICLALGLFFRFWFFKFLILIGITVGAFFIPDGTFHTGTNMLC